MYNATAQTQDEIDNLLAFVHRHAAKTFPAPLSQYKEALREWDLSALVANGEFIGVQMLKDNEIHLALADGATNKHGKFLISHCIISNLKTLGHLTTVAFIKDNATHEFLRRLGFKKTKETEHVIHYIMYSYKHKKKDIFICHPPQPYL